MRRQHIYVCGSLTGPSFNKHFPDRLLSVSGRPPDDVNFYYINIRKVCKAQFNQFDVNVNQRKTISPGLKCHIVANLRFASRLSVLFE